MTDEHNTAVGAADQVINETAVSDADIHEAIAPHFDDNQTVLLGRVIPYPVYTVVFGILAVITVLEIAIAEIIQVEWLKLPLLLGLALTKAILVILFYMHLRTDSRFFAAALLLPAMVALLSMLYLLGVPPTGY